MPTRESTAQVEHPRVARRRALIRVAMVAGILLVLVVAVGVGLIFERQQAYDRNIERITNAFPSEADRPAAAPEPVTDDAARAEHWLLVGSDRRPDRGATGEAAADPSWQRADTIMLVHLPADREGVYLVSFPRDSWVPIQGHGTAKINAALAYGGPQLLIATIEQVTGVRVDHFAMLDLQGFESMTDALGGVEVQVAESVYDSANDVAWEAGAHQLDGARALNFVRQRYNLPHGDFDRIKRQQAFLKALAGRVSDREVLTNPLRLNAFLEAVTGAVSVDDTVSASSLRSLAVAFRGVRPDDIVFMTVPTAGLGTEGAQSVVYIDRARSRRLYRSLRHGSIDTYVARTSDSVNDVDTVR